MKVHSGNMEPNRAPQLTFRILPKPIILGKCQPPSLINLKGQKNILGPRLEKAPTNLIYIGRQMYMGGWRLPKSKWSNPYSVKKYGLASAISCYSSHITNNPNLVDSLAELNGKILACWCHPKSCHGDILIELFNLYVVQYLDDTNQG